MRALSGPACTRRGLLVLPLTWATARASFGCGGGPVAVTYPVPELFDDEPMLCGHWVGQIGATEGELEIGSIDRGQYYGGFFSFESRRELVMLMRHEFARPSEEGALRMTNLVKVTWQDGRGGRGAGYVQISREGTGLTGQLGVGAAIEGYATLDFIRLDFTDGC